MELDPRTKLTITFAFALVSMFTAKPVALAAECVSVVLLSLALGLASAWWKMLRVLLPMTAFLVAVMLWSFDLATALGSALRLVALATAFFVFFQATPPEDLANALVASGVPYPFAFILTASMQFVPVLSRKMQEVIEAQRSRGIRLERNLASLRNYLALFAPLLIQSFTLADHLAEAMEARGFGAPGRTFAKEYRLGRLDFAVMGGALLFVFVGWQVR